MDSDTDGDGVVVKVNVRDMVAVGRVNETV